MRQNSKVDDSTSNVRNRCRYRYRQCSFHTKSISTVRVKTVNFVEKGTSQRVKEEATFMLFVDLLNSCEGTCHISTMCMYVTWFGTWHFTYMHALIFMIYMKQS